MHFRSEIIMPPTEDIETAIKDILRPFSEHNNGEDDDESYSKHAFWDWYEIGGRYSGQKLIESLDREKIKAFKQWLVDEKITVSGLRMGKESISPETQIEKVDLKWNEMFPSKNGELVSCPLFQHAGKEYEGDVLTLAESKHASAYRLIIAAPSLCLETGKYIGNFEAVFMLVSELWNGLNFQDPAWDGTIESGLKLYEERLERWSDTTSEARRTREDWLVVTVDYHS